MKYPLNRLLITATLVVAVFLLVAAPATATESDDVRTVEILGTNYSDKAFEVLDLVNAERAATGLNPLTMDQNLVDFALQRCAEITVDFSHERPNQQPLHLVFGNMMMAENIAYGYQNAADVMVGWIESPTHYRNIVRPEFIAIGIGCLEYDGTYYWVQIFGDHLTDPATPQETAPFAATVQIGADDAVRRDALIDKIAGMLAIIPVWFERFLNLFR